jgi:hypothetical protein
VLRLLGPSGRTARLRDASLFWGMCDDYSELGSKADPWHLAPKQAVRARGGMPLGVHRVVGILHDIFTRLLPAFPLFAHLLRCRTGREAIIICQTN